MAIKNYRRFLIDLYEQLQEALREAEDVQWHHLPTGTPEWAHYNRIYTWLDEVGARLEHYVKVKASSNAKRWRADIESPKAIDGMVQQHRYRSLDVGRSGNSQPDAESGVRRTEGGDPDPDDH